MSEAKAPLGAPGAPRKPLPRWKKVLLGLSLALFACGAGLKLYGYATGGGQPEQTVASNPRTGSAGLVEGAGGTSLVGTPDGVRRPAGGFEGEDPDGAEGGTGTTEVLSPAFMKGGLGFFLGFCMGYALRTFFKISAFFVGVGLLGYFGLVYFQVLPPPDWTAIEDRFNHLVESFKGQASAFQAFIASNLPSAGLGMAGVVTGFKKN
jgi:uncharacterized membrane protein (Fun14 family)